ncbi:dual specificity calcium/calmodulin-dependent 3',5'-cyclic nucleotide phosphodiesterase 1A isoform X4 [Falco biarmicus]|uniref:calcium/calmodulin-dependent 3',5'-cyclic nucleotide phosphodiesterase 1A isoform X2 n=1 Tax=Falco naumanni TaxID=148594 RepID=UPI001ADDF670|nr:calcium/calmodulin-dependent 3',5'-cyclic nucleotide phosphodiesterase 1A isoform X2 [Falco naumanni]XP_055575247.1 dual specificity calcium/calmodulin-dependent 3',5'-cyclic nucleotide phosphodiesterase 1A isoform X4 [Falco cherrug]XP_055668930.1 dual specificity calcium/calmodulin-dependent 3',5'-cyclic nucleotide phosphodiesterase 1A isoform X4 [Falco peregrinus]XP_056206200.1 dual specificity calcium/calmodulin-dependent 3',5'-cyclic nucleotide phosphodiesterase 1A isoform X4 [Falco biarm
MGARATETTRELESTSIKYQIGGHTEKMWQRLKGILRCLVKQLEKGDINVVDLKKNIEYAASVLEAVYIDETRKLLDTEDELSDIQSDSVPLEVRDWLASTFTREMGIVKRRPEEKPKFRSIVHAVQAGIFVERMYRRTSSMVGLAYPAEVIVTFKIPVPNLISFAEALEVGYSKYKNPYHNLIHAADVTQTVHYIMIHTGIMHWLTELEILAMIFAAAVHDYEHTGTTNNFHIQTRSDVAILYNDRSVLENHHVSAAYRLMQEEEMNILANLTKDDWRELRSLVIEMVLSTDMSGHFQQIKTMRHTLQQTEGVDKAKAMSLILHAADISHPAKSWELHYRWTMALMEEFFRQGDKEAALGLQFSPLCDRKSTLVAQSQIGFIDFIVEPTFSLLTDSMEKIVMPLIEEASKSGSPAFGTPSQNSLGAVNNAEAQRRPSFKSASDGGTHTENSLATVDLTSFKDNLMKIIQANKERWKELAVEEELVKNVGEQETDQSRNSTEAQLQEETTRIQNESSQGGDGTACPPRSIVLQVVSFDTPLSDESNSEKCTNSDPNQKDLTDAQQETQNTDPLNGEPKHCKKSEDLVKATEQKEALIQN